MKNRMNAYDQLASLVRQGDRNAERELGDRLGHDMIVVVRRIIRPGGVLTPLDKEIHAEACRMGLAHAGASSAERENLVGRLARRLRDRVLTNLAPSRDRDWPADATVGVGAEDTLQLAR